MIKVKKRKILLLPGDGIGPEVIAEVKKIIQWFNKNKWAAHMDINAEIKKTVARINADRKVLGLPKI